MADNVDITPGTGATIATDDVSGVQHQLMKAEFGAGGSATMVASDSGMPTSGTVKTFDATEDAEGDTVLFSEDVTGLRWVAVWMSSFADATAETGWVTFESSPDNSHWVGARLVESNGDADANLFGGSGSPTSVVGPVDFRYFRATLHNDTGDVLTTPVTVIAQLSAEPASLLGARSTGVVISTLDDLEVKLVDSEGASHDGDNPVPVYISGDVAAPKVVVQGTASIAGELDIQVSEDGRILIAGDLVPPWTLATVSGAALANMGEGELTFGGCVLHNANASIIYCQIFDDLYANVTLGTTVPTLVIAIPAEAPFNFEISAGIALSYGLQVAFTTEPDNDTLASLAPTGALLFRYA